MIFPISYEMKQKLSKWLKKSKMLWKGEQKYSVIEIVPKKLIMRTINIKNKILKELGKKNNNVAIYSIVWQGQEQKNDELKINLNWTKDIRKTNGSKNWVKDMSLSKLLKNEASLDETASLSEWKMNLNWIKDTSMSE